MVLLGVLPYGSIEVMEIVSWSMKPERVGRPAHSTGIHAKAAVFEYIERFCNLMCSHSSLGGLGLEHGAFDPVHVPLP